MYSPILTFSQGSPLFLHTVSNQKLNGGRPENEASLVVSLYWVLYTLQQYYSPIITYQHLVNVSYFAQFCVKT